VRFSAAPSPDTSGRESDYLERMKKSDGDLGDSISPLVNIMMVPAVIYSSSRLILSYHSEHRREEDPCPKHRNVLVAVTRL